MLKEEIKKLIDKINKRIKSAEKSFKFDEDTKKEWRKQLQNIVPNSDFITKSGLLSMSKSSIDFYSSNDMALNTLQYNMPETVTSLKSRAAQTLEDSGYEDYMTKSVIDQEVRAMINVEGNLDEFINNEWYEFMESIDTLTYETHPELKALQNKLYARGTKSYFELQMWMEDAQRVMLKMF